MSNVNQDINYWSKLIEGIEQENIEHSLYLKSIPVKYDKMNIHKKEISKKKFKKVAMIAGTIVVLAATSVASIAISEEIKDKIENFKEDKEIDDATAYIKNDLDLVVKSATHIDPNPKHSYINYHEIANYIETCENKELVIFTLYNTYGKRLGVPLYTGITDRTICCLEDDLGEKYTGLDDYVNKLGLSSIQEYEDMMRTKILFEKEYSSTSISLS